MRAFILTLLLFIAGLSSAQTGYEISFQNDSYKQFIKHPKMKFKDSLSAMQYLKKLQFTAISDGYLLASIDSILHNKSKAIVAFELGKKMNEMIVEVDGEDLKFIRKNSRLNEKLITNIPFKPREFASTLEAIEETFLNNGYPFVAVQLTNVEFNEKNYHSTLSIDRGQYYRWAKIHIKGDSSLSTKYISNLINIRPGTEFNESELKKIAGRIEQVPFIKELKPSEMLFTKTGAELYLYLESVAVSSVNGIVGFQPNPDTKKLSVTGELNLKLLDVLKRGELLELSWQSIQDQTQSLNVRLNYPFLFNTSFGIDGSFGLYKRDTSFLELNANIGVQYFLQRGSYIKAFYQYNGSNVLSGGNNNPLFDNLGNTSSNNYGLAYIANRVDYLPNPSRGFNVSFEGMSGIRTSQINDTTLEIKSTVYRAKSKLEFFLPIHKRHVLKIASTTDFYVADEIFQNEVYRYGGLSSQRGFNEDELFATTKTTGSIEYRFLLDKNSHVFAFYDQSWYENNASNYYNDSPFGFGVGFSFSTNLGVFSISYALGKQFSEPILLANSKVHFGYIAYF